MAHRARFAFEKLKLPLMAVAFVAGLTTVAAVIDPLLPKETPERARQRQAAEAQAAAAQQQATAEQAARTDRERYLCKQAAVCRRYGDARQDCAPAGDIRACIEIRMKGDSATYCTADGRLSYAAPDMPDRVRCAVLNWDL